MLKANSHSLGHTATLYQGNKLIIFGGENEHRTFLSDVVILDLETAHWTQPAVSGPIPKGRARHAAALYDDKLFIVGGLMSGNNSVLDDVCYLDLTTWTWSRAWTFVRRFDHAAWVWGKKLWVFGGLGQDMDRGGEICWLDLKGNPAFDTTPALGTMEIPTAPAPLGTGARSWNQPPRTVAPGAMGSPMTAAGMPHANASLTIRPTQAPMAPGISSLSFLSSPEYPPQASGNHFYVYSSNTLLDFVTPASTIRPTDCCLAALDLPALRWQKLAEGAEIFNPGYRWHYCAMNEDGTKAWLLGCATDLQNGHEGSFEEYLCDVLPLDLTKFGLLGNALASQPRSKSGGVPTSSIQGSSSLRGLGADLATMFDRGPEAGGDGCDFIVTAEPDGFDQWHDDEAGSTESSQPPQEPTRSAPIHVHRLILQARWPHFRRLYASQMAEYHTKRLHIPEPYSVVRAFLYYLYTDSIARHPVYCDELGLSDVAGLLVLANMYDLPGLRLLCVHRLGKEIDVAHAAIVWERASTANEDWVRRRAANFCLKHWGWVVRTEAFKRLSRQALVELCEEVDTEGRVLRGGELEAVGGLNGAKLGGDGWGRPAGRVKGVVDAEIQLGEEMEDADGDDEEGMEIG